MRTLTKNEIKKLSEVHSDYCISFYLPTKRDGHDNHQNRVRLKNLIKDADKQLFALNVRTKYAHQLLEPARKLLLDRDFWQNQKDGLAIYLSSKTNKTFFLPKKFEDHAVISNRFYIKPLISLLSSERQFFILMIGFRKIKLFLGTYRTINEINLESFPRGIKHALKINHFEKQLPHQVLSPKDGDQTAISHLPVDPSTDLLGTFHNVDQQIKQVTREEKIPLILAGPNSILTIYQRVNTYPHVMVDTITNNTDKLNSSKLLKKAQQIVRSHFNKVRQNAIKSYHQHIGTEKVSNDINVIMLSAYHGRVATLIFAKSVQRWGKFDMNTNSTHLHSKRQYKSDDLIDIAAIYTLQKGGKVFSVNSKEVPGGKQLAAVFHD